MRGEIFSFSVRYAMNSSPMNTFGGASHVQWVSKRSQSNVVSLELRRDKCAFHRQYHQYMALLLISA